MNSNIPQNTLYWEMIQFTIRARHSLVRLAEKKYNLSWMQLYTLCLLQTEHPEPMNALSCYLACDASNITGIIDRLEARELVRREDDPSDRRLKRISLTGEGRQMKAEIMADIARMEPEGFQNLSSSDRQQLIELIQKALQ